MKLYSIRDNQCFSLIMITHVAIALYRNVIARKREKERESFYMHNFSKIILKIF